MANLVEGLLEVYEDMVEVLLVLEIFLTLGFLSRFLIQLRRLFTMLHEASKRLAEHLKYTSPTV